MAVVLSDISAALYWEACNPRVARPHRVRLLDELRPPDARAISCVDAALPFLAEDKVHYLVSTQSKRHVANRVMCHSSSMSFPSGSFFRIEDEVYVVAPELSFIQMARCLPLEQLVHYGMMLCGVYYRTPVSINEGFDGRHIKRRTGQRDALVTLEDLAFYVQSAPHLHGAAKAKKALRHIIDKSRSPMETSLAMALCLPYRLGGCSAPKPSMNVAIYLDSKGVIAGGVRRDSKGMPYLECDLAWDARRVIVEYHGDESHFGREGVARDVRKANLLRAAGYEYYALTREAFASTLKFWEFASKLMKSLGHRLQPGVTDFEKRNEALRKTLRNDYLHACRRRQCVQGQVRMPDEREVQGCEA